MAFSTVTNTALIALVIFISKDHHVSSQVPMTPNNICAPNPPPLTAAQIAAPFSTCSAEVKKGLGQKHPDQDLTTPQILQKYGYPYKAYNITTKDNYILTCFRITGSPNIKGKQKGNKQAVYIQHGLFAASDCWNFQPGSRNLPFKLADAGYEPWLCNARGTTYSLGHKKYNSETNLEYWNFSWHEMGIYDLPAVTDKITAVSKNKKIFYIGHSMGTTMYFVALSEVPKMNKQILAGFMLAPIAYVGHCSNVIRLTFPLVNTDPLYQVVNLAMRGQIKSAQQLRTQFKLSAGDFCDLTATKCGICDNLYYLLFGYDAPQMNNSEISNFIAKFPNTISVKTAAHYAQIGSTCTFKKYDYGPLGNPKAYKSVTAPDYKLDKISAPTYFYYGEQDNLGPPNDVNITASKFKKGVLKAVTKVQSNLFNHVDFVTAKDADKLLYDQILKEMKKFK